MSAYIPDLIVTRLSSSDKATHPTNRQEDWEYIIGFCDQINKELEGPQIAVRLLVHKIHSPQEWEALQALTVLEACMKNCGRRFHNEVAKYRFLNELIKVVSPKYMGDTVSQNVKTKIIEMLYSWTVAFPNEAKISDAYQTLRRQGLVSSDPELTADKTLIPSPPTRPKNPVFDNEDMGKLLAELLRSKNPEDLQEANRLIKNMVKEDDARVQKLTKRLNTLEEVNNNVKLLGEMLSHYDRDRSSDADRELIKELYDRCDKLRRTAFKLATETEDNDTNLGCETTGTLIDLAGLDEPSPPQTAPPPPSANTSSTNPLASNIPVLPPPPRRVAGSHGGHGSQTSSPNHKASEHSAALSLLDDELLSLGDFFFFFFLFGNESYTSVDCNYSDCLCLFVFSVSSQSGIAGGSFGFPGAAIGSMPATLSSSNPFISSPVPGSPALSRAQAQAGHSAPGSPLFRPPLSPLHSLQGSPVRGLEPTLSNVHVPLDSIRPSKALPVTAYDKDGVRVLLHFATDCPPGRPDVLVIVVSMLNTAPLPVQNIMLQAAVPKSMKVKLQSPTGTELAPFNPVLPPSSITQVMLLANPLKEKVRLRYKLMFLLGERQYCEVGEVDQFPPAERWGNL
uniref:Golgi associated, gamma adaptin ear containing, ARF binding protein 3b n=1 Tax=Pygocentrus nattereri TaxID=42514 RepID=A0AAR2K8K5_PYGNA